MWDIISIKQEKLDLYSDFLRIGNQAIFPTKTGLQFGAVDLRTLKDKSLTISDDFILHPVLSSLKSPNITSMVPLPSSSRFLSINSKNHCTLYTFHSVLPQSLKIVLQGPPSSGKTTIAQNLAKFGLEIIGLYFFINFYSL